MKTLFLTDAIFSIDNYIFLKSKFFILVKKLSHLLRLLMKDLRALRSNSYLSLLIIRELIRSKYEISSARAYLSKLVYGEDKISCKTRRLDNK
mgnify:FL=1